MKLYNGDCLEVMDLLIREGAKADSIICDLPYGTTACKWDIVILFDAMWERVNKLIKPNGAIVLFGSEPFSSALRMSNIKNYKYDWYWVKARPGGFPNAKKRPLKNIETISVFSEGAAAPGSKRNMPYFPQGLVEVNEKWKRPRRYGDGKGVNTSRKSDTLDRILKYKNYPRQTLEFSQHNVGQLHSTQKPVPLMEYLIKTYTNENELVLDFTMGSGSTGVACKNTNRDFIGIELDKGFYDIACNRIKG